MRRGTPSIRMMLAADGVAVNLADGQWARVAARDRCVAPQTGQVAIPDAGSTVRKLAQPLVRQKGRLGLV